MKKINIKRLIIALNIILIFNITFIPIVHAFEGVENFLNASDHSNLNSEAMKKASDTIFNSFLAVGIVAAFACGIIIGIKLMMNSATDKAKVKEALVPYVIGVFVLFGAFGIWKMVINIGNGIAPTPIQEGIENSADDESNYTHSNNNFNL